MKSKLDFYIAFYERLALQGFQAYVDHSKEHLAMICVEGYNIAYLTKEDTIEPNPHAEGVDPATIEQIREIARNTALTFNICTEKPYDETKNAMLMDGAYSLAALNGALLSCRHHPILGYVFTVRKQGDEPQNFYNEREAKQAFAVSSGLVDKRLLFSDKEMAVIHTNLLNMRTIADTDLTFDETVVIDAIVNRIEDIMPTLAGSELSSVNENVSELSEGVEP